MLEADIINDMTLFPSNAWYHFYTSRNIFKCSYNGINRSSSVKEIMTLCHYVQSFGDLKVKLIAEKLCRHIIKESNFKLSDTSESLQFIKSHDTKLLQIAKRAFSEVYRYTERIKEQVEARYHCTLILESENLTFERFLNRYFAKEKEL